MEELMAVADDLGPIEEPSSKTVALVRDASVELALATELPHEEGRALVQLIAAYGAFVYTIGYHAGKGECSDSE